MNPLNKLNSRFIINFQSHIKNRVNEKEKSKNNKLLIMHERRKEAREILDDVAGLFPPPLPPPPLSQIIGGKSQCKKRLDF